MARVTDQYGLVVSTGAEPAALYRRGLDRLLTLESGGLEDLQQAVDLDGDFVLCRAVLATALAEAGAPSSTVRAHLRAGWAARRRVSDREASFRKAAEAWCSAQALAAPLVAHVRRWPRDAYAVSLLTPSIVSGGATDGVVEIWPLLDELAPSYGDDWWLTSLRAFARTEQLRFGEAEDLARAALSAQPRAGHGAHALAHVLYETGRHAEAVIWLDSWLEGSGAAQQFRGHFGWHAALCELAQEDFEAVARRYDRDLSGLRGPRALIDAGSLVARSHLRGVSLGTDRADAAAAAAGPAGRRPATTFAAWNAAALAVARRRDGDLCRLAGQARRHGTDHRCRSQRERQAWATVAQLCEGLRARLRGDDQGASDRLGNLGDLTVLGGSPAQRELLEELTSVATMSPDGRLVALQA